MNLPCVRPSRVGISFLLCVVLDLTGCIGGTANVQVVRAQNALGAPPTVDHGALDRLLTRYVDAEGQVDYAGVQASSDTLLVPYLEMLAATDPANLSRDGKLAFWINAYNAYTLKLIVDHYPVESINDIKPGAGPQIPKVNSPFQLDVGAVADTVRSLDDIEHQVIRQRFDEPRIHFALVCAAVSCPRLRLDAYTANALDAQLDDQARTFLYTDDKNEVPAADEDGVIRLSRIFKWFDEDFGGSKASTQRFLAPYFDGDVRRNLENAAYDVDYLSYDWSLNVQKAAPSAAR
jgi:hypothetical protein